MEGITLKPSAINHLRSILAKEGKQKVRIAIKTSGCSGLSYVVDTVNETKPDDLIFHLPEGLEICIDPKSYPFVRGMQVEYVREGFNQRIKFSNPNAAATCGCGESFAVANDDETQ